jgi:hypothetical protein
MLTKKQRLINQISGEDIDRIPMVGGWNLGVRNIAELAGLSVDSYLKDPLGGVIKANHRLGVDAIVPPIVPVDIDSIRAGSLLEEGFSEIEPEALKERADAINDNENEVLKKFDAMQTEKNYRNAWEPLIQRLDGLEFLATAWEAPANFSLYFQYGYEAFLSAVALYPEEVGRIYWEDAIISRERNKVLIKLMKEWDLIPMLFCGHDICVNRGPMVDPGFLKQHYWQHAKLSLEPFLDAGIRLIHHCDGNVMPLVDDMMDAGFSGFQGFQYECGVDPYELRKRRSLNGEVPLLLGGLSVSRTLPEGKPDDVIEDVDYILNATDGGRGLFLFTSNVTGVEVPVKNITAGYEYLANYDPRKYKSTGIKQEWPWLVKHPE